MRRAMRSDMAVFAAGLDCWLHKATEPDGQLAAEAAAITVAELLTLLGQHVTDGKWSA